jgi:hypothetical protein
MNASELVMSRLRPSPEELLAVETELATARARVINLEWLLTHLRARPEAPVPVPGLREIPPVPLSNGHTPRKRGKPPATQGGTTKANVIRDVALPLLTARKQMRGVEIAQACPAGMDAKDVQNALKRDRRFVYVSRGMWALASIITAPGQDQGNPQVPAPVTGTT